MAITTAVCTSFKVDLLRARHDFGASGGDTFKLALYTSAATLDATTTAYTATNEVSGTGYTAGGSALTNIDPTSGGTTSAFVDFSDLTFANATITTRGCLIYNDTITSPVADAAVLVNDFGSDQSVTGTDLTIQFPVADASNAILRLA